MSGGVDHFIGEERVDFGFGAAQFTENLDAVLTGHGRRPQIA